MRNKPEGHPLLLRVNVIVPLATTVFPATTPTKPSFLAKFVSGPLLASAPFRLAV